MIKAKHIFFFLLLWAITPALSAAAESSSQLKEDIIKEQKRLKELKGKIETEKKSIESADKAKKDILKTLQEIEAEIEKKKVTEKRTEKKLAQLKSDIEDKERKLAQLKKDIASQKIEIEARMISLYKFGSIGLAKALFSSDSYMALRERNMFMQLILKNDISKIRSYGEKKKGIEQTIKGLESDKKEKLLALSRLEKEKKETGIELGRKKDILASVNRSRAMHEKALQEMESSSKEINALIVNFKDRLEMESLANAEGTFSSMKGHLDFPAEGDIVGFFGKREDPEFKTIIFQKGIDIKIPEGTEIKTVFDGEVLYSDWFRGYGKIIIVNHGEGYYSLYAHASELKKKVNEKVKKGEIIALSGDTGSLKGPYLYFELRQKGKPIDPLEWLKLPSAQSKSQANNRRKR